MRCPSLRYRIGDRGALAAPGTGWQGDAARVLLRVTGRTVDAFKSADGAVIDGRWFVDLLYDQEWLSHFQVIQRDYADILIRIVRYGEQPAAAERRVVDGVRAVMGEQCRVEFDYCERIARPIGQVSLHLVGSVLDRRQAFVSRHRT